MTDGVTLDADRRRLAVARRQSPVALVVIAGRLLRRVGVVNLVVAGAFVLTGRLPLAAWTIATVAVLALATAAGLGWWRSTYRVDGDELVVTRGVVSTERLSIPLARVQSVSIEQRLLHRPIGLVAASVDTAGTSATELTLDAIARDDAAALQRLASAGSLGSRAGAAGASGGAEAATGIATDGSVAPDGRSVGGAADGAGVQRSRVLVRRTPRELVRVGLARAPWTGLAVLVPALAIVDDLRDLAGREPFPDEAAAAEAVGLPSAGVLAALVVLTAVAATALGTGLQVARHLVVDGRLALVESDGGLRRSAGLLSTTSTASSIGRVQRVVVARNPLQRRLGIADLTLDTPGDGDLRVPGSTPAEIAAVRSVVLGAGTDGPVDVEADRGISPRFVGRRVRLVAVPAVATPALLAAALGWAPSAATLAWWGSACVGVVAVARAAARLAWRRRRWGVAHGRLVEERGVVTRRRVELELVKAQAVTLRRGLLERRHGLATLHVRTAAGGVELAMIDLELARSVRDLVLATVETSRRRPM